ncbi:MAG: malto-oligosyltrehalose synthase [Chloroflexota bacterium]|nr:malto-oligosyltrehalose synthase [Chloroflexota bacterium]
MTNTVPIDAEKTLSSCAPAPPRATYRLQFNHTFTFDDAIAILPWLVKLGASHLYASPIFRATPGSMHGYDVVDFSEISPEIGGREGFDRLVAASRELDLGIILDFVPNHMGIENGANAWWQDVLEHGPASPYADYFDIDWTPSTQELQNKVLLPVLGDQYGVVLENGELRLDYDDGAFTVHYWDTPLPVTPTTYPMVLQLVLDRIHPAVDTDDLDRLELESVITALDRLNDLDASDEPGVADARYREQLVTRRRLSSLVERSTLIQQTIDEVLAEWNGSQGDPRSFDQLDALLAKQCWRVAFWRVAAEEINYRRFFAINTLAAIRQEEPELFHATHRLLMELLAAGAVDGVRIDHPDGLWDPEGYFYDLQAEYVAVTTLVAMGVDPNRVYHDENQDRLVEVRVQSRAGIADANDRVHDHGWPLYVLAEKILEHGEALPPNWPIAGTVGYDFAHATTALFVDTSARQMFDRIYSRFTGDSIRFPELVYQMKQHMMSEAFLSEMTVLTTALNRIAENNRRSRDFTVNSLRDALREIMASFPVYRTYTTCEGEGVEDRDRQYIEGAVAQARRRNPGIDPSLFAFIENVLLLHVSDAPGASARFDRRCYLAMKLQQLSGPVMAKGLEDTAFYRYNRLVSLNEVGGDPSKFGINPEEFHRQNRHRLRHWPDAMICSSTHDTKRGEDVRARISVLSQRPTEWRAAINRWSRLNRKLKRKIDGSLAPHKADEYVIYQTLVGTWPLEDVRQADRAAYVARLQEYTVKIAREAGRLSNWVNPDEAYEEALNAFIAGMFNLRRSGKLLDDIDAFVAQVLPAGLQAALGSQVLKLTSPGVPDVYQGTEVWDDSLVDPDNRRPVGFDVIEELVDRHPSLDAAWGNANDGAVKLMGTQRLLVVRAKYPKLFSDGEYVAVPVEGDDTVAFVRADAEEALFVFVALNPVGAARDGVVLPERFREYQWADVLRDSDDPITADAEGYLSLRPRHRADPVAPGLVPGEGLEEGSAPLPVSVLLGRPGT